MTDDKYLIPPPLKAEGTQLAPHPKERWRTNLAIGIACLAALFTGWQAWEARQARIDSKTASVKQTEDVERSRKAAEDSAKAVQDLAEAMKINAAASQTTADASERSARAAEQSLRTS